MKNEIKFLIYDYLFNRRSASVKQSNITGSCVLKVRKSMRKNIE